MRFSSWLNQWVSFWNSQSTRSRKSQQRLGAARNGAAEVLEPKQLLAATISVNGVTKELLITGTTGGDVATVTAVDATNIKVRVFTGVDVVEQTLAKASVAKVTFLGDAGADKLTNFTDIPVSMIGGDGNDTLLGGLGNDTFFGGLGDDSLHGNAGNDLAFGGDGNDTLFGAAGRDSLSGEAGNDNVNGAASAGDVISGGLGDDTLDGGIGQDLLSETIADNYTLTDSAATGQGTDVLLGFELALITGTSAPNRIDASGFTMLERMLWGAPSSASTLARCASAAFAAE